MKMTIPHAPRLLAGFGTLTLLAGLGLLASRPARTAGGPIAVNVANTPLATTPTTEPAFQPFKNRLNQTSATSQVATASFTVPVGKRLVIETVSSAYGSATVQGSGSVALLTTAGGTTVPHYLADTAFAQNRQNLSVRYYADPGSTVIAEAFSTTVGSSPPTSAAGDLELSGYYVDVP